MKTLRNALALTLLTSAAGAAASTPAATPAPNAGLERFKALAGDWVAAEDGDMVHKGELVASYRVTAAGSAVLETLFPGTAHEMITVYHADGDDLVLTHYCMEGNQPQMRAHDVAGRRIEFAFDGGSNIAPAEDRHMHAAWFDFASAGELRSHWTEVAEGKPVLEVEMHLVRQGR